MATLYTVGHGRRSADELIAILHEARIERLVDIRAFPASRRNPQFAKGRLAATLQSHRIRVILEEGRLMYGGAQNKLL